MYLKYNKGELVEYFQNKADQDKNILKYSVEFPITGKQEIPLKKEESDDEEEEEEDDEEEDKKEDKKENKKEDDKMKIDEPDEEGFILVKKGKKKGF